jgi:hypothetical protein
MAITLTATETFTAERAASANRTGEWHLQSVSDLTESENLLDSLEACGFADREFVVLGDYRFAVRWR